MEDERKRPVEHNREIRTSPRGEVREMDKGIPHWGDSEGQCMGA